MKKFILALSLILSLGITLHAADAKVIDKVKGKILIQVENHGEAWYVNPANNKKYYLGKPSDAFQIMKDLGIGITNKNLDKIPKATGGSIDVDLAFTNKNLGKIFLQVENHGEAWYVNPSDAKRYFLGKPADAFNIMKSLGLGITNNNINQLSSDNSFLPPKPKTPYVAPYIPTPTPSPTPAAPSLGGPNTSKSIGCAFNNPPCAPGFECQSNQCVKKIGCLYLNPPCAVGYNCSNNVCQKKTGCAYDNPKCSANYECVNGACAKKKGCINSDPACKWNQECKNNQCVNKFGCAYDNPMCGADETCVSNTCKKKTGCAYDNPTCNGGYVCENNKCVKKTGCFYNNPKCATGYDCVNNDCVAVVSNCGGANCDYDQTCTNNKCVAKAGCMYGASCGSASICINNTCKLKTEITAEENKIQSGTCCLDNKLKIGSLSSTCAGDAANLEAIGVNSIAECKKNTANRGYRYSKYYNTTADFAIVCTDPCSFDDDAFFNASFLGHIVGISALKNATGGVIPKNKIEFHLNKDGDCSYNQYKTGSAGTKDGHPLICNANYYWYIAYQGTNVASDYTLASYETIKRQTLTIHEPIHSIFGDYPASTAPVYNIQESFCKAVSLREVGTINSYTDSFLKGIYSLENPPNFSGADATDFFVYSLAARYNFGSTHMKTFFQSYAANTEKKISGNQKVKNILDAILGTNTIQSFKDIGITNVK
ncbi:hypothetical protein A2482_02130 [Candidatus Falkowbacteria bacterium RIFOXYC2_FULL_48_21]|uniref:Uncharacterized protein n=1 Tax=Candidatus Falkowbacteria bacterium RIFOXYC2_FULL_48_21 TaxID=1798005 RepID=A0A1F5T7N6_9BACT|nr:MAG: hypothetical protein A2482_02130 [Candidatus Falkowbacteria bacterium RIFOXYC2_FULL_48_21]